MLSLFVNFSKADIVIDPIWPRGGGGQFAPPIVLFAIAQKIFELGSSNFLAFLSNTYPSLKVKSWTFILPKCLILPMPD